MPVAFDPLIIFHAFITNNNIIAVRGVQNRTNPMEKPQTKLIQIKTAKNRTWFG